MSGGFTLFVMGDSVSLRNDHDYQLHKQWSLQEETQVEIIFLWFVMQRNVFCYGFRRGPIHFITPPPTVVAADGGVCLIA